MQTRILRATAIACCIIRIDQRNITYSYIMVDLEGISGVFAKEQMVSDVFRHQEALRMEEALFRL